jgi:predicted RNA binding protein YcfA (HicA-like mRNA interferase family)
MVLYSVPVGRAAKILDEARRSPAAVRFADLCRLAEAAGFALRRTRGSHHIYSRRGVVEIVDLQPDGKDAKPYQVRQVLALIEKYHIEIE